MIYRLAAALLLMVVLNGAALALGRARPTGVIAYVSTRDGIPQIYLTDVDRGLTRRLTKPDAYFQNPTWSPTGTLAFERYGTLGRDIVILNPFTGMRCEISGRLLDESASAWSPDGTLAYVLAMNGNYSLYTQRGCDGRTARNVSANFITASAPSWSANSLLAFGDATFGIQQVIVLDAGTGETRALGEPNALDNTPVWYGDHLLAFARFTDNWDIYLYDLQSGELRNVSRSPADDSEPAWSSDGRLAFRSNRDGNQEIYVYDPAAETLTNVSRTPDNDMSPAWSPDGRLAYASARGSVFDIVVLDSVPGSTPRIVASHFAQNYDPVWMPRR